MEQLLTILAAAFVALFSSRFIYFKILRIAKEYNLVDNPNARKLQKRPIPVLGGIAVFFGVLAAVLLGHCLMDLGDIISVVIAMSVMIYIGALDDTDGLSPKVRIIVESLAILGMIFGSQCSIDGFQGTWGIEQFSLWIAVPLTVFAGVGIINAMNMIDGVNGLSSGYCIVAGAWFGICFMMTHDYANALLAFAVSAATLPFFFHNILGEKSKMFIGDAGTMMMGIMVTWFVIRALSSGTPAQYVAFRHYQSLIAFSLAVMCVPVFDTLRVMAMRIYHHKSPFTADKTHLHHALIALNLSHILVSIIEIGIMIFVVVCWIISYKVLRLSLEWQLYVVIILSALFVWLPYFVIKKQLKASSRSVRKIRVASHQTRKHWSKIDAWLEHLMDWPEIRDEKRRMEQEALEQEEGGEKGRS